MKHRTVGLPNRSSPSASSHPRHVFDLVFRAIGLLLLATLVHGPASLLAQSGAVLVAAAEDTTESRYGSHVDATGWAHFAVYSPAATQVSVLLYDSPEATTPAHIIPMKQHGDDWRVKVRGTGIQHGLLYMYQAEGPRTVTLDDQHGPSFNKVYPLNDPYAYDTQNVTFSKVFSAQPHTDASSPRYAGGGKSLVYDHARDPGPGFVPIKAEDLIIYELHVQDYTARLPGLDATKRGTYLGLAASGLKTPGGLAAGLDHLVELGVNAVELMPVMEYDDETGNESGRLNHWGYMTTNFFAPETRYASQSGQDVIELKQLIKALHDRGLTVTMDVVYNHTGEGGPYSNDDKLTAKYYNLRGLCPEQVYRATNDGRFYYNNTGTGNDLLFMGGDGIYTKKLVTESLEMWHKAYGIDAFRFDLARILADGSDSAADWVDNDPDFASVHLHAEPWDMGGAWFDFMDGAGWGAHNNRWAKWLGRYRDGVRRFSKSSLNNRSLFKRFIEGYGESGNNGPASSKPWRSSNCIAVHDGYTLRDTTFFNNDDGTHNCWDSGGDENLRRERQKLMLGILFTSQGVPLILQGDEFGSTKTGAATEKGARDSYNYESTTGDTAVNHVNWLDWRLKDGDNSESPQGPKYGKELFGWTQQLIALRKKWSHFRRTDFASYVMNAQNSGALAGAGNDGKYSYAFEGAPDGTPTQLALIWWGKPGEPDLMVIYNESPTPFFITNLADWSQGDWQVLARSWFGADFDFADLNTWSTTAPAAGASLDIKGRSMAVLISDND